MVAEGWAESRRGAGTYIGDVATLAPPPARPPVRAATTDDAELISLRPGVPWGERTASAAWRRAWRTVSATPMPAGYPDAQGLPGLRDQVCAYLGRARGIATTPDELVITSGSAHGFRLLLDTLAEPPWRVAVEDPGYRSAVAAVRALRLALVDVPVDEHGLDVGALAAAAPAPQVVYVTPSHQHPTGVPMSASRRHALVAWARRTGGVVVEDDYDSEFRYDVAPLPALAQLDPERVVYLGTSSKTFGPGLRLGWLRASPTRVEQIVAHRAAVTDVPSWPVQVAYSSLLAEGYVDVVVRRERRRYADRSARVCRALEPFGAVTGRNAGLHVTLLLASGVDVAVRDEAREAGVEVPILAEFRRSVRGPGGLVVGYGGVSDRELDRALDVLTSALARRPVDRT
ncbi:MAG: aminotransferase class I/II-fold pyridoxal phosphate-dependent enzyme [Propionibacteriales bacterium]|nr:aminotransferase class I/II-fold pyridoxal phosphate-dependent enzyme [Propionibacteriales bacterium]